MNIKPTDFAFPVIAGEKVNDDGMNLRTYIATAALQGNLAARIRDGNSDIDFKCEAENAVRLADALIKELNKGRD